MSVLLCNSLKTILKFKNCPNLRSFTFLQNLSQFQIAGDGFASFS